MENNNINKNDIIIKAKDEAMVTIKKYARPRFISAVIEMFIAIVALFGINWVTMGLDVDAWRTPSFWVKTFCSTLGIFVLYRAVVNARYDRTAQRPEVQDIRGKYTKLNEQKETDLKDYLKIFNLQTKTTTYVDSVNRKIYKLEKKIARTSNRRRIEKIEKKIENLKLEISDEYITKNIDNIHIKYYQVFYSDFETDEFSVNGGKILTKANYNKAFNMQSMKKIWMYLFSSALLAVSVWQGDDATWVNMAVNIVATSIMVVTRIVTALYEADQIYDRTITKSLIDRTTILEGYITWKKDHPKQTEIDKAKQVGYENGHDQALVEAKAEFNLKLDEIKNRYEKIIADMNKIS